MGFRQSFTQDAPAAGWVPGMVPEFVAASRPCVLLVDDHPVNRMVARAMLEPLGLEVVEACDGAQAVMRCAERAYDAVLMDIQMPVMDGLEATRTLRRIEALCGTRRTRVMVSTASDAPGLRSACLDAGADDYLPKPIEYKRLILCVLEALRTRAQPCEIGSSALKESQGEGRPHDHCAPAARA